MEILLAIVVASAVIFFGALISIGNERQRKAIDGLREQVVLWAVQDLKIKREHLARIAEVPDPLGWLNKVTSKVCGNDLQLQILEVYDKPQSLVCISGDGNSKVIFSPLSPADLRRISSGKKNRLFQFTDRNPLLLLPNRVDVYELSILNAGYMFDLELSVVWEALTGQSIEDPGRVWIYSI